MLREQRHRQIMERLKKQQSIRVAEICKMLAVTEMTVRRDLQYLERMGLLKRTHGGAVLNSFLSIELSHAEKQVLNVAEKENIAEKAATLIQDNDVIFIGPGTTCEYLAQKIKEQEKKIKLLTNSIGVFQILSDTEAVEIILVGGRFRKKTGSFLGTYAQQILRQNYVKKAFIGANGINVHGISINNEEEMEVQRTIVNNAESCYVVIDQAKFNQIEFYNFLTMTDITAIITEETNHYRQDFKKIVPVL